MVVSSVLAALICMYNARASRGKRMDYDSSASLSPQLLSQLAISAFSGFGKLGVRPILRWACATPTRIANNEIACAIRRFFAIIR